MFHDVPRGSTRFHEDPLGFTKFHEIPRESKRFQEVSLNSMRSHEVPRQSTRFHENPRVSTRIPEVRVSRFTRLHEVIARFALQPEMFKLLTCLFDMVKISGTCKNAQKINSKNYLHISVFHVIIALKTPNYFICTRTCRYWCWRSSRIWRILHSVF